MGDPKMVILSREEFVDILKNALQSALKPIENDLKSMRKDLESMNKNLKSKNESSKSIHRNLTSVDGKLNPSTVSNFAPPQTSRQPGSL